MGKLEGIIRDEIIRLARREMRKSFVPLRKEVRSMRGKVSQLRKSVLILERFKSQQEKQMGRKGVPETTPEEIKKARFSPRLIRSLRKKLGISQKELAALIGVSVGAVHQWEVGKFQPKTAMKGRLAALRKLTRKDVKTLLKKGDTK